MQLPKTTIANVIKIKTPLWNGGDRKVGIATYKIGRHNEIIIEKKNADGTLLYPNPFYISGDDAKKYDTVPVPNHPNVKLYMIPIADLEVLERI